MVRIVLCLTGLALPVFSQRIPVPPSGTLAVSCRVDGVPYQQGKIFVDGREVGACPGATVQLSTGAHSVRAGEALGNDRYMAYQNERVEVQKDSTQNVIADLGPKTSEQAAGLAYALGARQVQIDRLSRPDNSKVGALSPDAKILAIGAETNSVRLYDTTDGRSLRRLGEPGEYWVSFVTALSFSADGNLLASNGWLLYDKYIGEINIWDVRTGRLVRTIPRVKEVFSLAFSPDGKLLAAGVKPNELKVWNVSDGKPLWSVRPPGVKDAKINQLMFSADGKLLIAGPNDGENISVYDARTAAHQSTLRGNLVTLGKAGTAFTFSYRGYENTLQNTWQLRTGRLIESRILKGTPATRALNEQVIAASGNVLDLRNEPLLRTLNDPGPIVLTPDGRRLLLYHDMGLISSLPAFPSAANDEGMQEIPTIGFCDMVKNAPDYFDKTVRLVARYEMATEGRYLKDDKCPLSHDQQIGAGSATLNPKQQEILNAQLREASRSEYGGRATVTVVGVLRNSSLRAFWWYQYRFDIVRVEDVSPVMVPYQGELQASVTYLANVRAGDRGGLSLIPALKLREHQATRIEWTNLNEFPELNHLTDKASVKRLVFTVLSDETRQVTESRWNRTIKCRIIHVD